MEEIIEEEWSHDLPSRVGEILLATSMGMKHDGPFIRMRIVK